MLPQKHRKRNTPAFTILAYFTFISGVLLFSIGLYNADGLQLNEKGYYIACMLLVAVGAILTQKVVRDNAEDNEIIAEQERLLNLKLSDTERKAKENSSNS